MENDNDVSLPKATIGKMVKECLPPDARVPNETLELIIECCTEFVQLLSSEANEVSGKQNKATILPEHVIKALDELGFQQFTDDVRSTWDEYKQDQKQAPKLANRKTMADEAGLTEEEQIALQKRLFAEAKARAGCTDTSAVQAVYTAAAAATSQLQQQQQEQHEQQEQHD